MNCSPVGWRDHTQWSHSPAWLFKEDFSLSPVPMRRQSPLRKCRAALAEAAEEDGTGAGIQLLSRGINITNIPEHFNIL